MSKRPLKAVVLGGTGAVGREVVGQLLCSPAWGSVVAVGRRAAEAPAAYASQPGFDAGKLQNVVCELADLEAKAGGAFQGADSVFCCLGTTRAAAGSADAFRAVDLHGVEATARAAAAARVPHFALVSAQGARAGLWAPDWKLAHGLLYAQCKGKAEEAVKAARFPRAAILQPGMLERGELARGVETWGMKLIPFLSSVSVAQVARCMVQDAERWHAAHAGGGGSAAAAAATASEPEVKVYSMKEIIGFE